MIKSIALGYVPALAVAFAGWAVMGGSGWRWLLIVWILGAMLTIAFAYVRSLREPTIKTNVILPASSEQSPR